MRKAKLEYVKLSKPLLLFDKQQNNSRVRHESELDLPIFSALKKRDRIVTKGVTQIGKKRWKVTDGGKFGI